MERQFWERLCESLQLSRFVELQYDDSRRNEIIETLRHTFRQKTLAEWENHLKDVDACWAAVRTVEEVVEDAHFRQRQTIIDTTGGGKAPGIAVKLGSTPGSLRSRPAGFGQHTDQVLSELGYSKKKIRLLRDKKVV